MQWMTMTSFVPCHALHAPQHAAASPFGPLNHSNDFFRPSCRSKLYITGQAKPGMQVFVWSCQLLDVLPTRASEYHPP